MTFDFSRRLATLEAENAVLRERLDFYRLTVFGEDLRFPLAWGLTYKEARLLAALLSPLEFMTSDALMIAIYGDSPDDAPDSKVIDVFVCKLRRKLRPYAIEIVAVWGRGYAIPRWRRDELRRAIRLTGPPWERPPLAAPRVPRPLADFLPPRTAERLAAQDRLALDA